MFPDRFDGVDLGPAAQIDEHIEFFRRALQSPPGSPSTRLDHAGNVRTIEHPLVLHLATHGFFGEARSDRDNPMFRSGLNLADIDRVQVDRERDDGQLTAYEVSGMDLRGTQLVVLSACETGLGGATKSEGMELMSEGISGLRRAFAMAGVRAVVVRDHGPGMFTIMAPLSRS